MVGCRYTPDTGERLWPDEWDRYGERVTRGVAAPGEGTASEKLAQAGVGLASGISTGVGDIDGERQVNV